MKNTVGDEDFGEKITVGGDKVSYATQKHSEDAITLQVNGVPVLVDPILMTDVMGAQNMKHQILVGPDDIKFTQWEK